MAVMAPAAKQVLIFDHWREIEEVVKEIFIHQVKSKMITVYCLLFFADNTMCLFFHHFCTNFFLKHFSEIGKLSNQVNSLPGLVFFYAVEKNIWKKSYQIFFDIQYSNFVIFQNWLMRCQSHKDCSIKKLTILTPMFNIIKCLIFFKIFLGILLLHIYVENNLCL